MNYVTIRFQRYLGCLGSRFDEVADVCSFTVVHVKQKHYLMKMTNRLFRSAALPPLFPGHLHFSYSAIHFLVLPSTRTDAVRLQRGESGWARRVNGAKVSRGWLKNPPEAWRRSWWRSGIKRKRKKKTLCAAWKIPKAQQRNARRSSARERLSKLPLISSDDLHALVLLGNRVAFGVF